MGNIPLKIPPTAQAGQAAAASAETKNQKRHRRKSGSSLLVAPRRWLLVDDAITASEHRETDITVIVQPGIVYRIHYQPDRHVFFVSTVQSGAMKQPMTLAPPAQAVECVAHPDRSRELWCGLGPQH